MFFLLRKHLVFPQRKQNCMELRPQPSVLWGSFTSVWWLQKVWKPQPPPGRGGAHLGHVCLRIRFVVSVMRYGTVFISRSNYVCMYLF